MKTYDDDEFTVVHVKTQEQWNEVCKALKYKWNEAGTRWSVYGADSCICLQGVAYSEVNFFRDEGDTILTYEEWREMHNAQPAATNHHHP